MTQFLQQLVEEHFDKFPLLAIVLHTEQHPYVVKALRDPDLWTALDKVSGPYVGVFATSLPAGTWEYERNDKDVRATMIRVWHEPAKNEELLKCFGLKNSRQLPVLTFLTMVDGEMSYKNVTINAESEATAFASLRDIVDTAAYTLEKHGIIESDHERAFELVRKSLTLKMIQGKAKEIVSTLSTLRGLLGV